MGADIFGKLHEECGVFGIYLREPSEDVVGITHHALYALQHRGQESCGIAVNDDGVITGHADTGLVSEVFTEDVLRKLPRGSMAIAHCRYGTTGCQSRENAQPLVIRHIKGGMALAHNGNLTNAAELRESFELDGAIFRTTSDSEVIAYAITRERIGAGSIEEAVSRAM
ncbi:MAG TPA: class II glutamine amidotransferase, partial [Candidatus Scatomorpha merdavium]|nr:class II glutamine amidotransferase [Candidatus Scatomorpha merdavium]